MGTKEKGIIIIKARRGGLYLSRELVKCLTDAQYFISKYVKMQRKDGK